MFLVRLLVLAVAVVMLLPADPASLEAQLAREDGRSSSFCHRYPKTCDASGELWGAFKRKLAYAVKLGRQSLDSSSERYADRYGTPKQGGRLGEWRRPGDVGQSRYGDGTLSPGDRSFAPSNDN